MREHADVQWRKSGIREGGTAITCHYCPASGGADAGGTRIENVQNGKKRFFKKYSNQPEGQWFAIETYLDAERQIQLFEPRVCAKNTAGCSLCAG